MDSQKLYELTLDKISIENIHPLHKAVLEECCENAINNEQGVKDENTLQYAVQVAFVTCLSTLKGTLNSSLEVANADQVTLNYRGQSFVIPKDSPLLSF